jgi:ABC-2 type transport system ATP-binding protein
VGALVEDATFYGYLNGRDNLEVLARTAGNYRPKRIEALLEQVGLAGEANRRVSSYSTGMKQRLGIAGALLGDPRLVILDEPTNGLDPGGRQEIRAFIRGLATQAGVTVFLSSHLLHEVEQVCDRVAIINHGEIVREGAVSDLLAEGQGQLRVQASPQESAVQVLQETWEVSTDGEWVIISAPSEESHLVVERLVTHDIHVHQVIVRKRSLEEYFMDATQEGVIPQSIGGNRENTHV